MPQKISGGYPLEFQIWWPLFPPTFSTNGFKFEIFYRNLTFSFGLLMQEEGLEAASGPWGGLVGGWGGWGGGARGRVGGWGWRASVGQPGGSQSLGPSTTTILLSVSRDRGSQPHHRPAIGVADRRG